MSGNQGSSTVWNRDALTGLVSLLVIAVLVFLGVSLTSANSDYVCSAAVNDAQQGSCTGGSWGPWTEANGVEQRTYTGTQSTVTFNGQVNNVSCSHPQYTADQAVGTITTAYSACQIVDVGTVSPGGTGGANGGTGGMPHNVTETVTVGGTTGSSSSVSGSYTYYQEYADSLLATSTFEVVPSILKPGETTQVVWTSSHVNSCTVTGSNSDAWTELQSPITGETSSPISQQTTYTLDCTTAIGTHLIQSVVVNIIPKFQEQ